jgi:hypothetical protein
MRALFVFLLVFGAFACDAALAQDAQVFGQVHDPSNASVDGAECFRSADHGFCNSLSGYSTEEFSSPHTQSPAFFPL